MKRLNLIIFISLLAFLFSSCLHDTIPFENVRKLKTGMSIPIIEYHMSSPLSYSRIDDSTETRRYVFDNAGNGMDKFIIVTYVNSIAVKIDER